MTSPSGTSSAEGSGGRGGTGWVVALGAFVLALAGILNWSLWLQIGLAAVGAVLSGAVYWIRGGAGQLAPRSQPATVSRPSPARSGRGLLDRLVRLSWQVIVIGVALIVIGYLASWVRGAISSRLGPPEGATDAKLLSVVGDRLRSCAKAGVERPINCPQAVEFTLQPIPVSWSLHGDPLDRADIDWDMMSRTSVVRGTGVMVARPQASGYEVKVVPFGYRATLRWDAGTPTLLSLDGEQEPDQARDLSGGIDGKRPNQPVTVFTKAVREAFERCVAVHAAELPPGCPALFGETLSTKDQRWSIENDPLLNASVGYDDEYGLVTVSGDYHLRVSYLAIGLDGRRVEDYTHRYQATVMVDDGKPIVLRIEDVP